MDGLRLFFEVILVVLLVIQWAETIAVKRALEREIEKLDFLRSRMDGLEARIRLAEEFGIVKPEFRSLV